MQLSDFRSSGGSRTTLIKKPQYFEGIVVFLCSHYKDLVIVVIIIVVVIVAIGRI